MSWYVYMLECKNGKLYTGLTKDLSRRLAEHNRGSGCRFTKFRKPVRLVYKQEFTDRIDAGRRERELKGFSRAKKLKLIKALRPEGLSV